MTRIEHLPSVIRHGLLSDSEVMRRGLLDVEIGYRHIKDRRAARRVPCGVGGTLADYVPFYFAPRSPMLSAITHGKVSREAARTDRIVYLCSSTQVLRAAGLTVVVSNRHPELSYAELTDRDEALDGGCFVDWPLMRQTYWHNTTEDFDRKERRQAECLVHPGVPWDMVQEVVAKTEQAAEAVRECLGAEQQSTPVTVRPQWYF